MKQRLYWPGYPCWWVAACDDGTWQKVYQEDQATKFNSYSEAHSFMMRLESEYQSLEIIPA